MTRNNLKPVSKVLPAHGEAMMNMMYPRESRVQKAFLAEDKGAGIRVTLSAEKGLRWTAHTREAARSMLSILPLLAAALATAGIVSGCSSSKTSKPQVVSIVATDANGVEQPMQPSALTVSSGTYLIATIANDASGLGTDWTVSCGSALPPGAPLPPNEPVDTSCGTFSPVHTIGGPVPNFVTSGSGYVTLYTPPAAPPKGGSVTIYASATANHSRFAALTLTILGLPISIGFAPQPPASIPVNGTAAIKAVLSNDYAAGGVNWTVSCGSTAGCGSVSPAQTSSGVATTYMAPPTVPASGSVKVIATSVTDPTKSISGSIVISPVVVTVLPATLSVAANGTGLLNATVLNDVSNAGVDWTLACDTPSECGSITAHTASGAASSYTAPATPPASGLVNVTATSTATPIALGTSTITVTATPTVSGSVRAGQLPVAGASVSLYAAGQTGYGSESKQLSAALPVLTDAEGRFTVSSLTACPSPASQLYVLATRGSAIAAQGDTLDLASLAFITPLGPCGSLTQSASLVLNEVTTVASVNALAPLARDATHIGAPGSNLPGLASAFAMAGSLVDRNLGTARTVTLDGRATVPLELIHTLANLLDHCLIEASAADDSGACTPFSRRRADAAGTASVTEDTVQMLLSLTRSTSSASSASSTKFPEPPFEVEGCGGVFQPSLLTQPDGWMLRLTQMHDKSQAKTPVFGSSSVFDGTGKAWRVGAEDGYPETYQAFSAGSMFTAKQTGYLLAIDPAGNVWVQNVETGEVDEFLGMAAPVEAPAQEGQP